MNRFLVTTTIGLFAIASPSLAQIVIVNPPGSSTQGSSLPQWGGGLFPTYPKYAIDLLQGNLGHISIDSIADLTGDGRRDLIVGIPKLDQVRVYNGRSGFLYGTIQGPVGTEFGYDVASVQDNAIDGHFGEEILIGAPLGAGGLGAAHLWSTAQPIASFANELARWTGRPCSVFPQVTGRYGHTVARGVDFGATGPFSGDELLVGAPETSTFVSPFSFVNVGKVEVLDPNNMIPGGLAFLMQPGLLSCSFGPSTLSHAGDSIALMSDFTGDGIQDYAAGGSRDASPTATGGGEQAYYDPTVSGSGSPTRIISNSPADGFGWASANVGDLDGDGIFDIAVGAPEFQGANVGAVYLYSGAGLPASQVNNAALIRTTFGPGPSTHHYGFSVSSLTSDGPGDLDGMGVEDYIVGEPCISSVIAPSPASTVNPVTSRQACADPERGAAYVISGETGAVLFMASPVDASGAFGADVTELDYVPTGGSPILTFAVSDPGAGLVFIF